MPKYINADEMATDETEAYMNAQLTVTDEITKGINTVVHKKIQMLLADAPAEDVQPVVYCKDCVYRKDHHYEEEGEPPYIKHSCKFSRYSMHDYGFCSCGKKRDGGVEHQTDNI